MPEYEYEDFDFELVDLDIAIHNNENCEDTKPVNIACKTCHSTISFCKDDIDFLKSEWTCDCSVYLHKDILDSSVDQIRVIWYTRLEDEKLENRERLIEIEERGVRFFSLQPTTPESIKKTREGIIKNIRNYFVP